MSPEIRVIFFYHLPTHIVECVSHIIFAPNIKTDTHKQKAKETKENRKIKETKEEKEEENDVLAFSTVSVENLTGYDYIVCEFALCNFNI